VSTEIDFSDYRQVERWLSFRRDVRVMFVARAALRVAPLLAGQLGLLGNAAPVRRHIVAFEQDIVLPVFRALATSWVAGHDPADRVRAAAAIAASGARDAYFCAVNDDAVAHAAVVADAAAYAAYAASTADVVDAANAAAATADATYDSTDAAIADGRLVNGGASPSRLAALPLWPAAIPNWAHHAWRHLEEALLTENQDWHVWTDWYHARLEGKPPDQSLEVSRVLIADSIWKEGPRAVNARIMQLIAGHGGSPAGGAHHEPPRRDAAVPVRREAALEPIWQAESIPVLAEADLDGAAHDGDELRDTVKEEGPAAGEAAGEKAFTWLRRLAIAVAIGAIASSVFAQFGQLSAKFPPSFEWLEQLLHFSR
jgi:hypothetical protein